MFRRLLAFLLLVIVPSGYLAYADEGDDNYGDENYGEQYGDNYGHDGGKYGRIENGVWINTAIEAARRKQEANIRAYRASLAANGIRSNIHNSCSAACLLPHCAHLPAEYLYDKLSGKVLKSGMIEVGTGYTAATRVVHPNQFKYWIQKQREAWRDPAIRPEGCPLCYAPEITYEE